MQQKQSNIIDFFEERYPALLPTEPLPQYFRVFVGKQMSAEDIIKLTSIHHPNIVNIKKILKIKKDSHISSTNLDHSQYAIYYEAIRIGKPRGKFCSQSLNRAIQFLICQGIFFKISPQNVGYNQQGNIKLFVPPSAVLGTKEKVHIKEVFEALNSFMDNSEGIQTEKRERMKVIDEQLKNLKNKLNAGYAQRNQYLLKINNHHRLNTEQSNHKKNSNFLQIPPSNQFYRETSANKLHQNFNCINIYQNQQPQTKHFLFKQQLSQSYSQDSDDTYEKQVGQKPEMPKLTVKNMTQTCELDMDDNSTVTKEKKRKVKRRCSINNKKQPTINLIADKNEQNFFGNEQSLIASIQFHQPSKFHTRHTFDTSFNSPWTPNNTIQHKNIDSIFPIVKTSRQTQNISNRVQQILKKTKTALQLLKQKKFRKSYQH